jgi:TolB-like protein
VWAAIAIIGTIALVTVSLFTRPLRPEASTQHRVVVLPLRNLTGDDRLGYVVDGLSEDLITHLGRLSPQRLAVIARTTASSYAGMSASLSRIASELAVDYMVEGAVRREQGRLHVAIRFVRTSDQSQVWGDMFDEDATALSKLFEIVVTRTATRVATTLGEGNSVRARASTLSEDAFESWLRGRAEWNRFTLEGFTASIEWFRRALAADPGFSAAAAALAQGWVFTGLFDAKRATEAYGQARHAVDRAIRLDADSPDALAMRGMVKLFDDFDRDGAIRDFDAAIARAPNDALALH